MASNKKFNRALTRIVYRGYSIEQRLTPVSGFYVKKLDNYYHSEEFAKKAIDLMIQENDLKESKRDYPFSKMQLQITRNLVSRHPELTFTQIAGILNKSGASKPGRNWTLHDVSNALQDAMYQGIKPKK